MKTYEVKRSLTKKELSQLISLIKRIGREAKNRGIEMSKRTAKHHALEHLGWTGYESEEEIIESVSFNEGKKTADPKYNKPL